MKNTVVTIQQMKEKGEKISMLTAYDYSTAKLEDEAGVNTILVGDSLGNVILGYGLPEGIKEAAPRKKDYIIRVKEEA